MRPFFVFHLCRLKRAIASENHNRRPPVTGKLIVRFSSLRLHGRGLLAVKCAFGHNHKLVFSSNDRIYSSAGVFCLKCNTLSCWIWLCNIRVLLSLQSIGHLCRQMSQMLRTFLNVLALTVRGQFVNQLSFSFSNCVQSVSVCLEFKV